jgi:hypothetical protein
VTILLAGLPRRRRDRQLQAAALEFTDGWRGLLTGMPDSYACYITCQQAEMAASLYRAAGDDYTADEIIAAHVRRDGPDDLHRAVPEPPAVPMGDDEVQAALGALLAVSGWERLEIGLRFPARGGATRYGGYCVRDRDGERYLAAETSDLLAGNGTFARGVTYDQHVIDRLAALLDASGWQRLEALRVTGQRRWGGWCERADGSGLHLGGDL